MPHLSLLERNFQLVHEWLKEICEHLAWQEEAGAKNHALSILRIVLQQLRDSLPIEASAHLSAQLPTIIRGLYFENWNPTVTPLKVRQKDQFLFCIQGKLMKSSLVEIDEELAVKAVFQTLQDKISQGEIEKLKHMLPRHIRQMWD
jgi:uncharacterized protein (DUF2267 family)